MQFRKLCAATLWALAAPALVLGGPASGKISGKVTYSGTPSKPETIDMSKDPVCVKLHTKPVMTEKVVTGPGNALGNVVVYISAGSSEGPAEPATDVTFDQQGCRYATHVLALRVGQQIKISNSDPLSHNIHPLAKINREWNRIQPAQTPAFSYAYEKEEFIPVKCNIHAWMTGYFVVLRTSHFAVTGEDGHFTLPQLPPGKYTVTAWHESYGTQSKEIVIGNSETQTLDFVFQAKP